MKREAADICIRPSGPEMSISSASGWVRRRRRSSSHADQQSRGEAYTLLPGMRMFRSRPLHPLDRNTEVPRIVDRYPQAAPFADCPELCEFYVAPERRSRGIGAQLLRRALQLARERAPRRPPSVWTRTTLAPGRSTSGWGLSSRGSAFSPRQASCGRSGTGEAWQNGPQVMLVKKLGKWLTPLAPGREQPRMAPSARQLPPRPKTCWEDELPLVEEIAA